MAKVILYLVQPRVSFKPWFRWDRAAPIRLGRWGMIETGVSTVETPVSINLGSCPGHRRESEREMCKHIHGRLVHAVQELVVICVLHILPAEI